MVFPVCLVCIYLFKNSTLKLLLIMSENGRGNSKKKKKARIILPCSIFSSISTYLILTKKQEKNAN